MSLLYSSLNSGTVPSLLSSGRSGFSSDSLLSSIRNLTDGFSIMCLVNWNTTVDLDEIASLSGLRALWPEKGLLRDLINEM